MSTSRLVGLVVLALGLLIAPSTAGGQTPGKVYRVGIIHFGGRSHVFVVTWPSSPWAQNPGCQGS